MVQVKSVITSINTANLRPIFHRFLRPNQRTMNVTDIYALGIPSYVCTTLDKILALPTVPVSTHIHRMKPLEPPIPKLAGVPYGLLCVARENVLGGDIVTNDTFIEPRLGDLILFHDHPYYVRPLQPIEFSHDSYMDVLWFMHP
jgi:hypothetical protein